MAEVSSADIPGWKIVSELLQGVREQTDETETIEDIDNDNIWYTIQEDSACSFKTKTFGRRKLLKVTMTLDTDIQTVLGCFMPSEEIPNWDENYKSVKLVEDYLQDFRHDDRVVEIDRVDAVRMQLPLLFRLFVKIPSDLKMRTVVTKDTEDTYTFLSVSWDTNTNDRNWKFKVRKIGRIERIGKQTRLVVLEKTGRWVPCWLVVKFAESGQTGKVHRMLKKYRKYMGIEKSMSQSTLADY